MTIQITYNSVNITLKVGKEGLRLRHIQDRNVQFAGSGKNQVVNRFGIIEGVFDAKFQEDVFRQLWGWWSWARQGQEWSFAMDSSDVANTTLDSAAAAAQAVVPLTATTNLAADDICLIRAEDEDNEFEAVKILSVSAGVSVTLTEDLAFSYSSGDTFRHFEYFPAVISMDSEFDPEREGSWYGWEFLFRESL